MAPLHNVGLRHRGASLLPGAVCRCKNGRLVACFAVSVVLHTGLLAWLATVLVPVAGGKGFSYTRVRWVRSDTAVFPNGLPEVRLPGERVVLNPLSDRMLADPTDAEELRRQMERMAALRADFFKPINLLLPPLPVLPLLPEGPLPPLWGKPLPLGEDLQPLPPLPQVEQALAQSLRQPDAFWPPLAEQPLEAPKAASDLLSEPTLAWPAQGVHLVEGTTFGEEPSAVAIEGDPLNTPLEPSPESLEPEETSGPREPISAEVPMEDSPSGAAKAMAEAKVESTVPSQNGPFAEERVPERAEAEPDRPQTSQQVAPGDASGEDAESASTARGANVPTEKPNEATTATVAAVSTSVPRPTLRADGLFAGLEGRFPAPVSATWAGASGGGALQALLAHVRERTRVVLDASAPSIADSPFGQAPFVYLHGEGKVVLSDEERLKLKQYVEGGGTLFVDGAEGELGESLRAELSALFGASPTTLSFAHPLYQAFYHLTDSTGGKPFALQTILWEERPAVLFSPTFLGRRWQDPSNPDHELAVAHGVNLVIYTLAQRQKERR